MATISPSPTTTSDAATAITAIAKTCPCSFPKCRAKAIRARFAPFSMISTESRMIRGLRRTRTPIAPVAKSRPASAMYHETSGPCIVLRPRMGAENDPPDGGDEQHDRGHLERDQLVREEQPPDRLGRPECARDLRRVRELAAGREADRDDHLDEDRRGSE